MKIETEFNPGDKVFTVDTNNTGFLIKERVVMRVLYNVVPLYQMENFPDEKIPEWAVASTREALKAKLVDNINKLFEG